MPRMDGKKLHTWEFQLKRSSRNMRRKLLQKRFTGKTTECSKHLCHITIGKNILSELSRCIFQIPLKYIKLFIPKILFILLLCSFNFYFKIIWPPSNDTTLATTKIKISDPTPAKPFIKFLTPSPKLEGGGGVHALKAKLELSPLIQSRVQQDYLLKSYARHLIFYQKCHEIVAPTRCGLFPLPLNLFG